MHDLLAQQLEQLLSIAIGLRDLIVIGIDALKLRLCKAMVEWDPDLIPSFL
jgi:hypothetical protein